MTHHRSPKRHALALAAGQLRRPTVEQRVDLQLLRDRAHFAFDFRHDATPSRRQHPQQRQPLEEIQTRHHEGQADIREHPHVRVKGVTLENHRDVPFVRPQMIDRHAVDENRTGRLRLESGNDSDQRGFAAARCADERQEFAIRNVKLDAGENGRPAKRLADRLELYAGHDSPFPTRECAIKRRAAADKPRVARRRSTASSSRALQQR